MTRIRPTLTIMQIEKNRHPSILHALRQLDVVVEVIHAVGGIDPDALADGVHAIVCEDGFEGLGFAGEVLVALTAGFEGEEGGDVGAFVGEGGGGGRDGEGEGEEGC